MLDRYNRVVIVLSLDILRLKIVKKIKMTELLNSEKANFIQGFSNTKSNEFLFIFLERNCKV